MDIEKNLNDLGFELPIPPTPVGNYAAYNISGSTIYISGQLPIKKDGNVIKGKIGRDLDIQAGREAVKCCLLNALGHLKTAVGDLNKVKKCLKITGYINSTEDFYDHSKLLNVASDILVNLFGKKGEHSRVVVGVPSLPLNAAVEIVTIFEIE